MAVTWRTTYMLSDSDFPGLSNGYLTVTNASASTPLACGSVGKSTGKWYWEYTTGNSTNNSYCVGVMLGSDLRQLHSPASGNNCLAWRGDNSIIQGGTQRFSAATVGVAMPNGTIGVAVDCDAGKVWFARNNSWIMSGNPGNGTSPVADASSNSWWYPGLVFPMVVGYVATSAVFASESLAYTPPSGFSALTDANDWAGHFCSVPNVYPSSLGESGILAGNYKITGTVDRLGVIGRYRVRLFLRNIAYCLAETWSDASGNYAFYGLAYIANGYFAIAYDANDNPLNAAISDLITPELMQ